MIKSGWVYAYGMGFWGPNGHDGVWHIALINSLAKGTLEMPVFSGVKIQNYHLGFDALLALIVRLTHLPAHWLYFQIVPLLIAPAVGIVVYQFVKAWRKSESEAWWAVAFTYFATSWGWVISLTRYKDVGGESMFWAQQAISSLLNPPFALSLVVMFAGLWCVVTKKYRWAMAAFGILGFIKIYAGLLLLGGLFLAGAYEFIIKRNRQWLVVWTGAVILSLLFFIPLNKSSGQVIVWQPGWFLETMMAASDRVNWPKFYEAMINYKVANWPKAILAYAVATGIFIIGNLGLRVVSLFKKPEGNGMSILMLSIVIAGFAIPMFFLQRGTPWNTIQFTYYSLVFSGILAGIYFARFKSQVTIITLFIILTFPGVWGTLRQYLPARPPAMISKSELEGLKFLAARPQGIVLTPLFDKTAADAAQPYPPRPLYLYESTAYVAAFSAQPTFLEDEVNLNITNFDWQPRAKQISDFFTTLDPVVARNFLAVNHIKYIYLPQISKIRPAIGQSLIGASTIFDNHEVAIWEVN